MDWYGICAVGAYFGSPTDEYSIFASWGFLDDLPSITTGKGYSMSLHLIMDA